MKQYVIALDQGTTSSRAILFDREQKIVKTAQTELTQYYPKPGWVEHDPMEIYSSQTAVMTEVLLQAGIPIDEVAAIGIANQRETTIVWDRETGLPIYNAIVWQCRRTADICEQLKADGLEPYLSETTGLIADAYFSGPKIRWILDHVPGARKRAENGDLLFGTVDSWLIWKLTDGRAHVTDYTNASRTMLFDIRNLCWDERMLQILNIPRCMLPEVRSSSEVYGTVNLFGHEIPIAGAAGDQHAALFGQNCFAPGDAKNTYGTGCFLLMNTGKELCRSKNGMLTTIASGLKGDIQYAVEGSIFVGGAVVQWLRDEMGLISESRESERVAAEVPDNGGVYVVPAFTGLGAPHWDMYARGAIFGLTRGTGRSHIVRAALESIAYQSKEVLDAICADTGIRIGGLRADGGASANDLLMQFQADMLNCPVLRPMVRETTALGAACLAGLAVGLWKDKNEISQRWTLEREFVPAMPNFVRERNWSGWTKAVARSKNWAE